MDMEVEKALSSVPILEKDCSSDTDSSSTSSARLGVCEVCNFNNAKYRCPKCEVKTCCLKCLNIHKKELNCDGIRDRTKYIPLKNMTKMDFLSDYNFLEECTRYVEDRKRDRIKRFTRYDKNLPSRLFSLRNAAQSRKITLKFLLQNFSKRNMNNSYYNSTSKQIFWRIEWIFPNAENLKCSDLCNEDDKLCNLINKYLDPSTEDYPEKKLLEFYQSKGLNGIRFLLKTEGIKRCRNRFYELDCDKTLKENLIDKTLVEFPIIFIVFKETSDDFDVINSDEDIQTETKNYQESLTKLNKEMRIIQEGVTGGIITEELRKDLECLQIRKKRMDRQKKREEREKEPQNLLFTDESMWDDLSSDSHGDNDSDTEEESGEATTSKKIKTEEN